MMRLHLNILSLLLCALCFNKAYSQELTGNDITNQLWLSHDISYKLSEMVDISGELGFKTISPKVWNRYFFKSTIKFSLPKIMFKGLRYKESLSAGVAFFFTDNKYESNRLEIRPYQGYLLDWPDRDRFQLRHYLRLEERFDLDSDNWVNTFGLRLRYLLTLNIKLQGDVINDLKGTYIPVSVEYFWNLIGAKQFNDVIRTYVGVGYNFQNSWRADIRMGYQYARNTTTEDFSTNDLIYGLNVFYRIK